MARPLKAPAKSEPVIQAVFMLGVESALLVVTLAESTEKHAHAEGERPGAAHNAETSWPCHIPKEETNLALSTREGGKAEHRLFKQPSDARPVGKLTACPPSLPTILVYNLSITY